MGEQMGEKAPCAVLTRRRQWAQAMGSGYVLGLHIISAVQGSGNVKLGIWCLCAPHCPCKPPCQSLGIVLPFSLRGAKTLSDVVVLIVGEQALPFIGPHAQQASLPDT